MNYIDRLTPTTSGATSCNLKRLSIANGGSDWSLHLIIQAQDATVDVEVDNIESLLQLLNLLREIWDKLWCEIKNVAEALGLDSESHHGFKGIRKDLGEITADAYEINVLYKAIDNVSSAIRDRFQAITAINSTFRFL